MAKFSFSQEEQTAIIGIYSDALSSAQQEVKDRIEDMRGLCERVRFLPMIKIVNEAIQMYSETLPNMVNQHFNNWCESESSLVKFAEKLEAGEDARKLAERLQSSLEEEIQNLFKPALELVQTQSNAVDGSEAMSEEKYEELEEIVKKLIDDIEEIEADSLNKIDNGLEDNNAYACIKGVVSVTLKDIYSMFEKMHSGMGKVVEDFTTKMDINQQNAEDFTQQVDSMATSAGDAFANFASMFKL